MTSYLNEHTKNNGSLHKELILFNEVKGFENYRSCRDFLNNLSHTSALYVLIAASPISRLIGESPILKIGETKDFKKRMTKYFRVHDINTIKDKSSRQTAYHIRNYLDNKTKNSVKLLVKYCPDYSKIDLKKEEKRLLSIYLANHFEVPPLNMGLS